MPPLFIRAISAPTDSRIASAMRLPIAASPLRTVARRLSSSVAVRPITISSSRDSSAANPSGRFGLDIRRIDDAEVRLPFDVPPALALARLDGKVDGGEIVALGERFHEHRAAVELDRQIMIVTGEYQLEITAVEERAVGGTSG